MSPYGVNRPERIHSSIHASIDHDTINSNNVLSLVRHQAINPSSVGLLLIGPLGIYLSESIYNNFRKHEYENVFCRMVFKFHLYIKVFKFHLYINCTHLLRHGCHILCAISNGACEITNKYLTRYLIG